MVWYQFFIDYKWYLIGLAVLLIVVYVIGRFLSSRKSCKHKFIERGHFVLSDKPRLLNICSKCGVAIHTPIYTRRRLAEIETELDRRKNYKKYSGDEEIE